MTTAPRIPVIEVDLGPGIRAFFTTRHGGTSSAPWSSLNLGLAVGDDPGTVRANRARVDEVAGAPVVYAHQVHGQAVAVVDRTGHAHGVHGAEGVEGSDGSDRAARTARPSGAALPLPPEVDALVTAHRGVPLGVYVADCVPVLLADARAGLVAAVHAGRPGVEAQVVAAAVAALRDRGATLPGLRAVVGPAVCGACYEVPEDLRERVGARVPAARSTTSWGTPALDLPRAVLAQLDALGVDEVEHVDRCTRTDDAFFSHRRSSAAGSVAGRFAGVVHRL